MKRYGDTGYRNVDKLLGVLTELVEFSVELLAMLAPSFKSYEISSTLVVFSPYSLSSDQRTYIGPGEKEASAVVSCLATAALLKEEEEEEAAEQEPATSISASSAKNDTHGAVVVIFRFFVLVSSFLVKLLGLFGQRRTPKKLKER